ncbi:MAG: CDP-glycerol glycerophosphotransferase family protein [Mycoplasmatales bacterium]
MFSIKLLGFRIYMFYLRFYKVKPNRIFLESFGGNTFGGTPKVIYDQLKDNKDYQIIVSLKKPIPNLNVKVVKRNTFKYYYYLATSKVILTNGRIMSLYIKRKKQVYIQTWHGTPLKHLVHDSHTAEFPGGQNETYLKRFDRAKNQWDYLLTQNNYSTEIFKQAFKYEKEILEIGYPRNKKLYEYTDLDIKRIRAQLGITKDKKVILYTPTYRDNIYKDNEHYQDMMLDLELLSQQQDIVVLLRTHYFVTKDLDLNKYKNIINVSDYQDINNLYLASDCLLNDYSSTMFDYLILNKSIILFPYDYKEYMRLRGMYFNYNDIPARQIKNTKELIDIVRDLDSYNNIYKDEYKDFKNKFIMPSEKDSTNILINKINEIMETNHE